MSVNCKSLKKNYKLLNEFLSLLPVIPSVIAFTETWLVDGVECLLSIPGYVFISKNRESGRGGGVGLYICNSFDYEVRTDMSISSNVIEILVVEIKRTGTPNLILSSIYRPPNTDIKQFNAKLEQLLDSTKIRNKFCFYLEIST